MLLLGDIYIYIFDPYMCNLFCSCPNPCVCQLLLILSWMAIEIRLILYCSWCCQYKAYDSMVIHMLVCFYNTISMPCQFAVPIGTWSYSLCFYLLYVHGWTYCNCLCPHALITYALIISTSISCISVLTIHMHSVEDPGGRVVPRPPYRYIIFFVFY